MNKCLRSLPDLKKQLSLWCTQRKMVRDIKSSRCTDHRGSLQCLPVVPRRYCKSIAQASQPCLILGMLPGICPATCLLPLYSQLTLAQAGRVLLGPIHKSLLIHWTLWYSGCICFSWFCWNGRSQGRTVKARMSYYCSFILYALVLSFVLLPFTLTNELQTSQIIKMWVLEPANDWALAYQSHIKTLVLILLHVSCNSDNSPARKMILFPHFTKKGGLEWVSDSLNTTYLTAEVGLGPSLPVFQTHNVFHSRKKR